MLMTKRCAPEAAAILRRLLLSSVGVPGQEDVVGEKLLMHRGASGLRITGDRRYFQKAQTTSPAHEEDRVAEIAVLVVPP